MEKKEGEIWEPTSFKNVTQHQISQWIEYEYDLLAKIQDKDQMFLIALNTDWYYNDYGHDGSRNMRSNKMWKAYWIPRKNLGWKRWTKQHKYILL